MNNENKKTLLLVEDEPAIAKYEKELLEECGYNIITEFSGEKAIDTLNNRPDIDLILMDINLGKGLDGTQTAEIILKNHDIPIIFLSSHVENEIVEKTEKITSYGYYIKKSGITILNATIKMAFKLFEVNKKLKQSEKNFHVLFDESPFPTLLSEIPSGKIKYVNKHMVALIGKNPSEIIGKTGNDLGFLKNPEDQEKLTKLIFTQGYVDNMEVEKVFPDGGNGIDLVFMRLITINEEKYCLIVLQDITERKHAEDAMRIKTMFLESLANSSFDGILVVDGYGNKVLQNKRAIELWRIPKEIVEDTDGMKQVHHVMNMTKNPEQFVKEIELQKINPIIINKDELELIDGRVLERYSSPVIGENGHNYGRIYTFHDITEQKKTEERIKSFLVEKELVLKEVHHRIKNNMNSIISLLTLQSSSITEQVTLSVLDDAKSRIQSMMILYDKLYQSTDYNEMSINTYLSDLVDQIVSNFPNSNTVKIIKNIEDFVLDSKQLSTLGIIINELLTNIMKYAFINIKSGIITVTASLKEEKVFLSIEDNGNGMPESVDFKKSTGFGLMLVEILTKQIQGKIRIERNNGTKIILEFTK